MRILKQLFGCVATIIIFLVMISYISDIVEKKTSKSKYDAFYSQEEDFDVLFMGSSHMFNAVFPMELWNDYGIVSYNCGGHASRLASTYWIMMNALEHTTPKLIVVDCYTLGKDEKISDSSNGKDLQHISFDSMPLGINKVLGVLDLMENSEDRLEFIWEFSVYHNRWNEVTREDFEIISNIEKGAETGIAVIEPNEYRPIASDVKLEGETVSMEYLRKIIKECQRRDIEVLLTYMPYPATTDQQREANSVQDIADEYGVNYINFLNMNVVDLNTDCYDADSHMNASGGKKITEYLGAYIMEHYEIQDQRENPAYAFWNEDYEAYTDYKIEALVNQGLFENYLMLLYDKSFSFIIDIRNDSQLLQNQKILYLLENCGIDTGKLSEGTRSRIWIEAGGEHVDYLDTLKENGGRATITLGELAIFYADEELYGVYLNGEECFVTGRADGPDCCITVFNHRTGEWIDTSYYTSKPDGTVLIERWD